MKLDKSQILIASLLSITTCSGLVLSMSHTYADDSVTDNITITVPESCSISSTIDTAHTATFSAGTWSGAEGSDYENGIGKTTLTTFCNDNNGFSIYAIGFTDDTLGTTTLVGSNTNIAIPTKAYESGDTASNWSMKITKVENPSSGDPVTWNPNNLTISNNFNSWHAVPDDYTRVAEYHAQTGSSTTDTALGAKLETTYATFISPTQPADTYTGKVKYVMVHPYNASAPEIPSTGLCQPGQLEMQNVAQWKSTITSGNEVTACDNRDGKTYTVAKLADNNLWMTQNLDHDISTSYAYTNENTDIGWNASINSYNSASWTPVASTHLTNDTEWYGYNTSTNPDGGDEYHAESYDPGNLYWNDDTEYYGSEAECIATGETWDDGTCYNYSSIGDPHYHLGNFYNWTAAVAMNESSTYITSGELIEQSICPAGWTLPRIGNGEDTFKSLWDEYSITETSYIDTNENYNWDEDETALWSSPLYFIPSGRWFGEWRDLNYGFHWSPIVISSEHAGISYFSLYYDDFFPSMYNDRHDGNPVRCVARPVTNTIEGLD